MNQLSKMVIGGVAGQDLADLASRFADPDFYLSPQFPNVLAHLREHSPVHWCQAWESRGFWAITRYEDIKRVFEQPLIFSSAVAGNIIPADPNFHLADREAMGFDAMPTNTDPPKHGDVRRLFARHFSGPAVAKLELLTQHIFDEILDEVRPHCDCNFVLDVAAHLPARLICEVLGVPRDDWPMIADYANSFASFTDPDLQLGATPADTFRLAMDFLFSYVGDLVEQRRIEPRDDFASIVAGAECNGAPLPHRDAAWWAFSILAAGFETSRHIIAGGVLALIEHPEQRALLKSSPQLLHQAVEEMVRWTSPATANLRVAVEDTEIAGQAIRAGDWTTQWLFSGNRDEAAFDRPDVFDIQRRRVPSLAFGHGPHNCIGRMLALLEVKVVTQTLLVRTDRIELIGPVSYVASTIARGPKYMPVRIHWT